MTEPSQKALDCAARKAGYDKYENVKYPHYHSTQISITAHARTLDELWAIKPPKTRGELFAGEVINRQLAGEKGLLLDIVSAMIDEGWEPKDD